MKLNQSVTVFATCIVNYLYPEVADSVARFLKRLGVNVSVERGQACCGQPFFNSGHWGDASKLAKKFLETYKDTDHDIVIPSGSCVSMIRNHYSDLFEGDPEATSETEAISARIFEFTEYVDILFKELGICDLDTFGDSCEKSRVTYHDACHLRRELGISRTPRRLLEMIPGVELIEMERAEVCCGFGGTFAVKYSEISSAMLDDKLDTIIKSQADVVTAADSSCLMNIAGGLERRNTPIKSLHIAEVLDHMMPDIGGVDKKRI